jgi:EmrB/QacA subfamily drug resistance transporter
MAHELAMNAVQMGWVPMGFSLTGAILILPFGRLSDIYGRKKIFIIGILINTVAVAITPFSTSAYMLITFQLIQGVGFAMLVGTSTALLTSAYPPHQRGRALGILVAAVYLGLALGPSLGGLLTYNFGWRSIFLPTILLQIAAIVLVLTKVKSEWADAKGEKYDIIGSILIPIMLFCLLYGFSLLPSSSGICIIVIGLISVVIFVRWELRLESPIFNISHITKNRLFSFSSLTHFLFYTATFATTIIMSLYLQYIKGFNAQEAGLILLITPIIMAAFSPLAGRTSDRVQPRVNVSAAIIVVLIGILLLFAATFNEGMISIIIALALLGLGFAFFVSPNTNAIMSSVDKKYYGIAAATQATTRQVGVTFSISIIMLLFSLFLGKAQITPEYYPVFVQSIQIAFIVFVGLGVLSIVFSIARGRVIITQNDPNG